MKKFRTHENVDILATAVDADDTQVIYTGLLPGWGPNTKIELGSEVMLVTEVDTGNKVASVVRGHLGTTAAAHAVSTPIYISPRIYRSDIMELLNDCLEDLFGQDLYAVGSEEIAYDGGIIGYEIPAEATKILRVDGLKDDFALYWEPIFDWLEVDNTDTGDFSSSRAIMLRTALPPGAFRVIYAKEFGNVDSEADDLVGSDIGLRPYMIDLLYYYATSRVMVDQEPKRSQMDTAQNHQRAQDVPAFLALRTGEWYKARYEERVKIARAHLLKETKVVQGTGYGS